MTEGYPINESHTHTEKQLRDFYEKYTEAENPPTPKITERQLGGLRTFRGYTEDEAELAAMAADEIDRLSSRLTTAEQEREEYASECRVEAQRRRVAEARVEAAEQYVAELHGAESFQQVVDVQARLEVVEQALRRFGMHKRDCYDGWQPGEDNPESCSCGFAAALACPPQQRGE